jgi:RNA polymerase sigma-70 factor (ECF subfamily)
MLQHQDIVLPASHDTQYIPEAVFAGERERLVRFCSRLTGNAEAAEDLAQETLLEVWRNLHKFDVQDGVLQSENWRKWVAAIARNVCKRWARSYYHDRSHVIQVAQYSEDETEASLEDLPLEDYDIELELERDELVHLLDRALALLPPSVRDVLIERYIRESSHAEIADRLGLSEDALVQRLHRGKLALRRVLTTQMRDEAVAYGISVPEADLLHQQTRIWCPLCGKGQLIAYQDPSTHKIGFTCSKCMHIAVIPFPEVYSGINSHKSILSLQLAWLGDHYWRAINSQQVICWQCGSQTQGRIYQPQNVPPEYGAFDFSGVYIVCAHCGYQEANGLPHLSLDTPEARQFWRRHPRMQWLPAREIAYAGQPALISSFQSISDTAQLDIICQQATLKVLAVHESTR